MKRPRAFFLVAAWYALAIFLELAPLFRPVQSQKGASSQAILFTSLLPPAGLLLMIWLVVGLVKLKRFHRWFAVGFFCVRTLFLVWSLTALLGGPSVQLPLHPRGYVFFITTNLLCAWYLSRPGFRELADRFVAEREKAAHSRMMQKAAEWRIRAESRRRNR
jgi:hypothetical protein